MTDTRDRSLGSRLPRGAGRRVGRVRVERTGGRRQQPSTPATSAASRSKAMIRSLTSRTVGRPRDRRSSPTTGSAPRGYFANAEHRDLFAEKPVQYAPQYGGHCAMGTAFGESTANIDPEAWSIVDGKLYLQYSKGARESVGAGSREQDRGGRSEVAGGRSQGGERIRRLVGPCRRNVVDGANWRVGRLRSVA